MSIDVASSGGSGGNQSRPESHDHDEQTPSRVYVNGIRLPVGDVDLHMRNEGPLDFTRYAEGKFVSPYNGEDYAGAFDGLNPNDQESFDTIRIDVLDHATERYFIAFQGIVTGVGNTQGQERIWRFRAQGPGHLLSNTPASKNFSNASALDIVTYVADELRPKLPFTLGVIGPNEDTEVQEGQAIPEEFTIDDAIGDFTSAIGDAQTLLRGEAPDADINFREAATEAVYAPIAIYGSIESLAANNVHTPHSFQSNRDTLADVIEWLKQKTDTRVWFSPTSNGVTLNATDEYTLGTHSAHYLDGDLHVVNNDALSELKPSNTLTAKGIAVKSVEAVGDFGLNSPQDEYSVAKVRHQPLYKRAGNTELHADVNQIADAVSKEEVVNEAKSMLRQKIGETTEGDMQTLLRAPITPFDTIDALPTCDEEVATNMDPITYEVTRVHHEIRASGIPQTTLNVGIYVEADDINVLDSWVRDV